MAMMNMQSDPSGGDWFAQNAPQQGSAAPGGEQRIEGVNGYYQNAGDFQSGGGAWVPYSSVTDPTTGQPYHPPGQPGGIMLPGQQTGPASSGTAPQITNPSDPNQVRAFFQWRASQQGADPYLSQPGGVDYYTQKALENGGLTDQNYWTHKSTLAQFGGAVGAGGGQGGGNLSGGFGDTWNKLPSLQDAMNMPGLQFALDRGSNAIQRSAFAHGTGLSGGMLKDLGEWNTGAALQGYGQLANLNLNYNNSNASNLTNLGQLGLNASSIGATGRPA